MFKKAVFIGVILVLFASGSWFFSQGRFQTVSLASPSFGPSTGGPPPPESVRVIFVGDVMLSRGVVGQMEKNQDYTFPFLKIKDFLNSADFVFGNLEGPISDKGTNQGSIYSFRADPQAVVGLQSANFRVLSLANNHIWDWGKDALLQTVEILSQNSIFSTGAGKDYDSANRILVLEEKGIKLGFFSMTSLYPDSFVATRESPGISNPDFDVLANAVKKAKAEKAVDFLIVSLHWGNEYEKEPQPWQREQAHKLADAGADVIVGHHPHVVQSYEKHASVSSDKPPGVTGKQSLIFYSLGNFVFDQSFSEETMESLAIEVDFKKTGEFSSRLFRVRLNENYQPELGEVVDSLVIPAAG